jgi:hypothetical protein
MRILKQFEIVCGLIAGFSAIANASLPTSVDKLSVLNVAQYFVAADGSDTNTGLHPDAPLATLEAALSAIQQRKGLDWHNPFPANPTRRQSPIHRVTGAESYGSEAMGPVIIWLRGGVYRLKQTVDINFADSHPLVIAAYPGERPILDGSRELTGFEESMEGDLRIWRVSIPQVASGDWFFRQLFVNGERAPRSTLPAEGFFIVEDSLGGLSNPRANQFISAEGDFRAFKNIRDIEISVLHYWINHRLAVESFDPVTRKVTTVNRTTYPFLEAHPLHGFGNARYRLENVIEGLQRPGQWHLDSSSGILTYLPRAGETLDNTSVEAPHLVQLIRVQGDLNRLRFVEHLRLSGLTFRQTAIDFFAHNGTHNNAGNSGPGVVSFSAARNCIVEECNFLNIGSYGIELNTGSSVMAIVGNTFKDMGCGAIKSSGAWLGSSAPAHHRNWINWITDNTIHRGGRIFHGSPAIIVNKSGATVVAHNEVVDFFYNGIVLTGGPIPQFAAVDSRIENNLVHTIGQGLLSDMGAIYVHGSAGGVVVRGNVAYDVTAKVYGGSPLYLDDSAGFIVVEDNLFYNGSTYVVNVKGRENIMRNNIFAFAGNSLLKRADLEPGRMNSALLTGNILLTDGTPVFSSRPETDIINAPGIVSDANIIWDIAARDITVAIAQHHRKPAREFPFADWQNIAGNDRRSLLEDPAFVDPLNGDFTLEHTATVDKIGFRMPDFSRVGPRPREQRSAQRGVSEAVRSIETHVE